VIKTTKTKTTVGYVILSCAALFMVGCATKYQADGFTGGFTETQVAENVWRVAFRGNGYTRSTRAEELALLRSADLAIQNGFRYFAFIESRIDKSSVAITSPTQSTSSFSANSYGGNIYGTGTTTTYGGNTTIINRPSAVNTVMMFKNKPELPGVIYDANFVCDSVGRKYEARCGVLR
jgi:hypothetical protein